MLILLTIFLKGEVRPGVGVVRNPMDPYRLQPKLTKSCSCGVTWELMSSWD